MLINTNNQRSFGNTVKYCSINWNRSFCDRQFFRITRTKITWSISNSLSVFPPWRILKFSRLHGHPNAFREPAEIQSSARIQKAAFSGLIQGVPEHPSTPFFSRTMGPKFALQKDLSGNRLRRIWWCVYFFCVRIASWCNYTQLSNFK